MGRRRLEDPAPPEGVARAERERILLDVLPAIRRQARSFHFRISRAVSVDDLVQLASEAAWRALVRPGTAEQDLRAFCIWKAGRVMVDAFQAEQVHERNRGDPPEYFEPSAESDTAETAERRELLERVCEQVDRLEPREREVMRRIYACHEEQAVAAKALGVAQSRVCAIHLAALKSVRRALRAEIGEPA